MEFIREDGSLCQLLALRAEPRSCTFADARCSRLLWAFLPWLAALACRWQRLGLQCAGNSRFELTQVTEHRLNQLTTNDPKQISRLNLRALQFKTIFNCFQGHQIVCQIRVWICPWAWKAFYLYDIVFCLLKLSLWAQVPQNWHKKMP